MKPGAPLRNGFSRQILDGQIRRARELADARSERLNSLRSRSDVEAYQAEIRTKIHRLFRPLPRQAALDPSVTRRFCNGGVHVENVHFQSASGLRVTANFYHPSGYSGRLPGILVNCGHHPAGKAFGESQSCALELAARGFAVLVTDPICQGERVQHSSLPESHPLRNDSGAAHCAIGQQLSLVGDFLGSWMVRDAMAALAYLGSRPEVDRDRLAVTGNSGGGCLSTYLWALDPRVKASAPSCWVNSFLAVIENEVGGDAEQMPPGALAVGLEQADFFIMRAPAPVLLIGQRGDFFDHRALQRTAEEVRRVYGLLRARDQCQIYVGEATHSFTPDAREKMVDFFAKVFAVGGESKPVPGHLSEVDLEVGSGGSEANHRFGSVHRSLWNRLNELKGVQDPGLDLQMRIRRTLRMDSGARRRMRQRNLRSDWLRPGILLGRYALETEPGNEVILRKVMPKSPVLFQSLRVEREVCLYVPHWSAASEFLRTNHGRRLLQRLPVFAVEVRGIGESMCRDCSNPKVHEWMDYLAQGFEELLGRSLLGCRVYDLIQTLAFLRNEGAEQIDLVGFGQGSLVAALAAALDDRIRAIELHRAPKSFASWLTVTDPAWPAANFPRGVLRLLDLPDVYRSLGSRLTLKSHWAANQCLPPPESSSMSLP